MWDLIPYKSTYLGFFAWVCVMADKGDTSIQPDGTLFVKYKC